LAKKSGSNSVPNADDGLPPSGLALRQAFEALVSVLNEREVSYAVIGGLATLQHTRARSTEDVDVLLSLPQIAMPGLFEALGARGFTIDLARNIQELRDEGLTLVSFHAVLVDLLRPVVPALAHVLERAVRVNVLGQEVRIASAEGLIVTKLIAMRPQDEADVRELLVAYSGNLDLDFIRAELADFSKSGDPRLAQFDGWVRAAATGGSKRGRSEH
jgi:predicted nucleotidyltransferase